MKRWGYAVAQVLDGNIMPLLRLLAPYIIPPAVLGILVTGGLLAIAGFGAFLMTGSIATQQATQPGQSCHQESVITGAMPVTVPEVYRQIFVKAAASRSVDAMLLTTVFWVENGRKFKDPPPPYGHGNPWPVSGPGASGPFQFMPGTWVAHAQDGNGDGVKDVNDLTDAAYAAADLLAHIGGKAGTPLGDPAKPYASPSLVNAMATYNAGHNNFFNPETVAYVHNGAAFYRQLQTQAPVGAGSGQTTITVCAPIAPANNQTCTGIGAAAEVYLLGSGLANEVAHVGLPEQLQQDGFSVVVNTVPDRTLTDAIGSAQLDAKRMRDARVIVIELGSAPSAGYGKTFTAGVTALIAQVRQINPVAHIFWVNQTAGTRAQGGSRNQILASLAPALGYEIINWFNLVFPGQNQFGVQPAASSNGWLAGDPVQALPNAAGAAALGGLIEQTVRPLLGTVDQGVCPGSNAQASQAVAFALAKLGIPYLWGGTGLSYQGGRFDCSGLTQAAYQAAGIKLPRVAADQYAAGVAAGHEIRDPSQLLPGDLVFFGSKQYVHHVGIYLYTDSHGNQYMVDAPSTGSVIRKEVFRNTNSGPANGWNDYYSATRPA